LICTNLKFDLNNWAESSLKTFLKTVIMHGGGMLQEGALPNMINENNINLDKAINWRRVGLFNSIQIIYFEKLRWWIKLNKLEHYKKKLPKA